MAYGIRTGDPHGFNKGHSSKFHEGSEYDKHLKKAGGYIGQNVVEITIKMKTIARKPLMIKITKCSFLQKLVESHKLVHIFLFNITQVIQKMGIYYE